RLDFFEQTEIDAIFFRQSNEGLYVLGQAESSEAETGIEEIRANARIEPHSPCYFLYVSAKALTKIGDEVGIGDLQAKKRVGGMLDQFGAGDGRHQKHRPRAGRAFRFVNGAVEPALKKGLIDFPQLPLGFRILHTYHDAVRVEEIRNRSAFAQKLRVGGDPKRRAIASAIDL